MEGCLSQCNIKGHDGIADWVYSSIGQGQADQIRRSWASVGTMVSRAILLHSPFGAGGVGGNGAHGPVPPPPPAALLDTFKPLWLGLGGLWSGHLAGLSVGSWWWMAVGSWRLAVGSWQLVAVGNDWRLVVGGG